MRPTLRPPLMCLRLVQEYRGRRIVTNGTMYGILGELVTDCRYLNVEGARAAINSELAIAERHKYLDTQRRAFREYAEDKGRTITIGCDCGWCGQHDADEKEGSGAVVLRCPKCAREGLHVVVSEGADRRVTSRGTRRMMRS